MQNVICAALPLGYVSFISFSHSCFEDWIFHNGVQCLELWMLHCPVAASQVLVDQKRMLINVFGTSKY